MIDLKKELLRKDRYHEVFLRLREKARAQPYRLNSAPVNKNLTLRWALTAQEEITSYLIKEIKGGNYQPDVCRLAQVNLDKQRCLYSFSWPDRIFELVLGRLLAEVLEPFLSKRVFSFRPGYSNFKAVREFAQFVKTKQLANEAVYIVKRDVENFGDTIDTELLLSKIQSIAGKQDPYLFKLLDLFIRPFFIDSKSSKPQRLFTGLPTGCAITPVLENFYLSELDLYCQSIDSGFYCRYGDDILFAHGDEQVAIECIEQMQSILAKHHLVFKTEKQQNIVFWEKSDGSRESCDFATLNSINYLGLSIDKFGEIFLSSNKLRELKSSLRKTAKHSFHSIRRNCKSSPEIVNGIINSLNLHFKQSIETPHLSLLLHSITNEKALADLDKWIAKLSLRYVYGTSHDKVFRYQSYRSLRKQGLLSLVHLRRLAHRGII